MGRSISSSTPSLHSHICCVPSSNIHKSADAFSHIDDQLLYGQRFSVTRIEGIWAYGQARSPFDQIAQYEGYVRAEDLALETQKPDYKIGVLKAPIFSAPDIKSAIVNFLSLGSLLRGGLSGDYFSIQEGFIHKAHIAPMDVFEPDYVRTALLYLELPYVWGGKTANGVDCSGLVQTALWAAGIDCPRDAGDQEKALGSLLDIKDDLRGLKRGDLAFWKGHVGVMCDAKNLLHSNGHHMKCCVEPLNVAQERIGAIYGPLTSVRRL